MHASEFPRQFLIRKGRATSSADSAASRRIEPWTLATDLPVAPLRTAEGADAGWLIGWAAGEDARFVSEPQILTDQEATDPDAFEDWLYAHVGRFAAVWISGEDARLYLDAMGSLAAVFPADGAPQQGVIAASTPTLLARAAGRDPVARDLPARNYWIAGVTPDPAVRRLLPNHYLDLAAARPVRHHRYAPAGSATTKQAISNSLDHAFDATRRTVRAATEWAQARGVRPLLPLTAGKDSRMVLAAARPVASALDLFSIDYAPRDHPRPGTDDAPPRPHGTENDAIVSGQLAAWLGLACRSVPVHDVPSDLDTYMTRIGHTGEAEKCGSFYSTPRKHFSAEQPLLTGFAGEAWRACYRPALHEVDTPEKLYRFVSKQETVRDDELRAAEAWMNSFQWDTARDLMDHVYIEWRLGAWAAAHFYGFYNPPFVPLASRPAFRAALSLPFAYRRRRLGFSFTKRGWPKAAYVPFNKEVTPVNILRYLVRRIVIRAGWFKQVEQLRASLR